MSAIDLLASGGIRFLPWARFVCWIMILFHGGMIALTVWSALTEKPLTVRFLDPNYNEEGCKSAFEQASGRPLTFILSPEGERKRLTARRGKC
jgi:hypothetical protein